MTGPRLSRTARRTAPLPRNWAAIKRACLARDDHRCQWHRLQPGERPCHMRTHLEPHHLGDPADHGLSRLLTLCRDHHSIITGREARAIQLRGRRTPPPHPGLRLPASDTTNANTINPMNSANAHANAHGKDPGRGLT